MAEKFLEWDAANNRYKANEALVTSAGAGDAGKIVALDANGKLDSSLIPTTSQIPAGTIMATISASADPGWEMIDGTTVVGAQTSMPALWAKIPASWKSGSDMVKPDWRERTLGGYKAASATHGTLGGSTGANTVTIAQGNLPAHVHTLSAHTHTINHDHASVTSGGQSADHTHSGTTGTVSNDHVHNMSHSHPYAGDNGGNGLGYRNSGIGGAADTYNPGGVHVSWHNEAGTTFLSANTGGISANHNHGFTSGGVSAGHTHTVDLPNFTGTSGGPSTADTSSVGSGTALSVVNAAGVVNWMIKAH